ncbi:MAG: putative toxin-antitoxin system toxin component, PIN family [Nanoarchaeota archaeon]|nr:putative toxin-antitoxin system toxin component, PIN family [Nanoarchaeota archaeon]
MLDTNIFISGLFWEGQGRDIVSNALENELTLSFDILDELSRTLWRKFGQSQEEVHDTRIFLINHAAFVQPQKRVFLCEDPDDNKILECALECKAHVIITRDNHLLKLGSFKGIPILRPEHYHNP